MSRLAGISATDAVETRRRSGGPRSCSSAHTEGGRQRPHQAQPTALCLWGPRRTALFLWYTHPRPTGTRRRSSITHCGRGTMAKRIGFGNYQYEVVEQWPRVEIRGAVADVCVDARGRVYAGVRNPRDDGSVSNILGGVGHVLILDRDGREIGSWGNLASSPHGIWVNPAGEIYLADTGFHTITKHAPTGELLLALGTKGHPGPDGQPFNMPTHAVEAPNGDIFVSDGYGQNRIHRFSARGEHLLTFGGGDSVFIPRRFNLGPVTGRPGTDPCQFNVPHELLVTEDHLVYVMDRENHRWQVFTTDGTFVSLQEHVSHPNRVALDA